MKKRRDVSQSQDGLSIFEWVFVIGILGLGCSLVIFAFWVSRPL